MTKALKSCTKNHDTSLLKAANATILFPPTGGPCPFIAELDLDSLDDVDVSPFIKPLLLDLLLILLLLPLGPLLSDLTISCRPDLVRLIFIFRPLSASMSAAELLPLPLLDDDDEVVVVDVFNLAEEW